MKTTKLIRKYTSKELAESFIFRSKLSAEDKRKSDMRLKELLEKSVKKMTPQQILFSRVLQLKYQIEDYLKNQDFDKSRSFSYFLRIYLDSLNRKNKDFANDINIDETELSQILNKHRKPSEKIVIRLEIHSNKIIPAIFWFRLLEKEKEYEILTNNVIRKTEGKFVKSLDFPKRVSSFTVFVHSPKFPSQLLLNLPALLCGEKIS